MSISPLTYQQSVFKRYHSDKHLSDFYLQDGGKKSTGIDMERLLRHCHPMYSALGRNFRSYAAGAAETRLSQKYDPSRAVKDQIFCRFGRTLRLIGRSGPQLASTCVFMRRQTRRGTAEVFALYRSVGSGDDRPTATRFDPRNSRLDVGTRDACHRPNDQKHRTRHRRTTGIATYYKYDVIHKTGNT